MPTAAKSIGANFGGKGTSATLTATFDTELKGEYTLVAGKPVGSWVKTDSDTAAGTLTSGHGLTSGTYDVYFTAGVRYGVDVTISTNSISLDGGTGTAFPASADTSVVVCKQVEIDFPVTGNNVHFQAVAWTNSGDPTTRAHFDMQSSGPASVYAGTLKDTTQSGGHDHILNIEAGETNNLSGDVVAKIYASNGSIVSSGTLTVFFGVDQTP